MVGGVDGVEHLAGVGEGFGVGVDFFDEGFFSDINVVFIGLAEACPGVGETGELVGGVVAFADAADGVEEEGADEEVAAEMGGDAVGGGGGGGKLVDVFEELERLIAVGAFFAPALEVGVIPTGESDAEVANEFFLVGSGAGPSEGIGIAGFELQRRDIAVDDLGEEPVADLFVLPAVLEMAVEFFADGLGEESEATAGFARGNYAAEFATGARHGRVSKTRLRRTRLTGGFGVHDSFRVQVHGLGSGLVRGRAPIRNRGERPAHNRFGYGGYRCIVFMLSGDDSTKWGGRKGGKIVAE